jgi:hypothetical protein
VQRPITCAYKAFNFSVFLLTTIEKVLASAVPAFMLCQLSTKEEFMFQSTAAREEVE